MIYGHKIINFIELIFKAKFLCLNFKIQKLGPQNSSYIQVYMVYKLLLVYNFQYFKTFLTYVIIYMIQRFLKASQLT